MAKNIVTLNVNSVDYTTRPYGTCSTAASTSAKVVTCADFDLVSGTTIMVKFDYINSAPTPTLNVNGKGAKNIFNNGLLITSGNNRILLAGVVEFMYDGTLWHLIGKHGVSSINVDASGWHDPIKPDASGQINIANYTIYSKGITDLFITGNNGGGYNGSDMITDGALELHLDFKNKAIYYNDYLDYKNDGSMFCLTSAQITKLNGIAANANNYSLPAAGTSLGGVKSGGDVTISNGVITVNNNSHSHSNYITDILSIQVPNGTCVVRNSESIASYMSGSRSGEIYIPLYDARMSLTINLTAYSSSKFYPVMISNKYSSVSGSNVNTDCYIVSQNGGSQAAYNCNWIHFSLNALGWTDLIPDFKIYGLKNYVDTEITIGAIGKGTLDGGQCIWLRGGLKYEAYCNKYLIPQVSNYTLGNEKYTVGTNLFGGTNANVDILWLNHGPSPYMVATLDHLNTICNKDYTNFDSQDSAIAYLSAWSSGTNPFNILLGNAAMVFTSSKDTNYVGLLAFGFGGPFLAYRNKWNSSTWSAWEDLRVRKDELGNNIVNTYATKTRIVNHGTSDTNYSISPNTYHKWGLVSQLTLTLSAPSDTGVLNVYMCEFKSGSVATIVAVPNSVVFPGGFSIAPNKTHYLSIVDNVGVLISK